MIDLIAAERQPASDIIIYFSSDKAIDIVIGKILLKHKFDFIIDEIINLERRVMFVDIDIGS